MRLFDLSTYIPDIQTLNLPNNSAPWNITQNITTLLQQQTQGLDSGFTVENGIAIHKTATIEQGAVLKAPAIIDAHVFIGAHAYLRGGVWLMPEVVIDPGVEVKSSILFRGAAAAHFNFIGDSLIGAQVNLEAGATIANHHNDRADKTIYVKSQNTLQPIPTRKFGALVGDHAKIGANAVLNPGTILPPHAIVGRLTHINQEQN